MTAFPGITGLSIASRGSALAMAQAALVPSSLERTGHHMPVDYIQLQTEGDADRTTPLRELGGRGVFVHGVQAALLDGRADIAVHSLKDMPTEPVEGLMIGAMLTRGD